jgi:hypothetical protein
MKSLLEIVKMSLSEQGARPREFHEEIANHIIDCLEIAYNYGYRNTKNFDPSHIEDFELFPQAISRAIKAFSLEYKINSPDIEKPIEDLIDGLQKLVFRSVTKGLADGLK